MQDREIAIDVRFDRAFSSAKSTVAFNDETPVHARAGEFEWFETVKELSYRGRSIGPFVEQRDHEFSFDSSEVLVETKCHQFQFRSVRVQQTRR